MTLNAEQIVKLFGKGPTFKEADVRCPLLSRLSSLSLEKSRTFVTGSNSLVFLMPGKYPYTMEKARKRGHKAGSNTILANELKLRGIFLLDSEML